MKLSYVLTIMNLGVAFGHFAIAPIDDALVMATILVSAWAIVTTLEDRL